MFNGIDLSSDTATKPTQAMKAAMLAAPLGDEQKDEDPTTRALEHLVAEQLGLGDAVFLPSATMANEIAILLQAEPGTELLAADTCHLFLAESGAPAMLARVMCKPIPTTNGIYSAEQVLAIYHQAVSPYRPKPTLISVENTTNLGGGYAWPQSALTNIITCADTLGLKKHLDGARLFNASIASQLSPAALATGFNTVTLCFSKGLGCPVGAVLGLRDPLLRAQAKHYKHLLGGSMRQSGILAAAGIYALEHHVARLETDHKHAKMLAQSLKKYAPTIALITPEPQTNIITFDWQDPTRKADDFYQTCLQQGLRFSRITPSRFRAVTHLDVSENDVIEAESILAGVIG